MKHLREYPMTEDELKSAPREKCIAYSEETAELLISLLENEYPKVCVTALSKAAAYYAHKAEVRPTECIAVMISHYNEYTISMAQAAGQDHAELVSWQAVDVLNPEDS